MSPPLDSRPPQVGQPVLLVGNALNRTGADNISWERLLAEGFVQTGPEHHALWFDGNHQRNERGKEVSYGTLFEALLAARTQVGRADPLGELKAEVAQRYRGLNPTTLHQTLWDTLRPAQVLTTNYDYALEGGPDEIRHWPHIGASNEKVYSLFRVRMSAGKPPVWHIHGEANAPDTLLLGEQHYLNSVAKLNQHFAQGKNAPVPGDKRSPLLFEDPAMGTHWSWADHFLLGNIHIIGLSMDLAELDLWWLLRFRHQCLQDAAAEGEARRWQQLGERIAGGSVTFHQFVENPADPPDAKHCLLEGLGVNVESTQVHGGDYEVALATVIGKVHSAWHSA